VIKSRKRRERTKEEGMEMVLLPRKKTGTILQAGRPFLSAPQGKRRGELENEKKC